MRLPYKRLFTKLPSWRSLVSAEALRSSATVVVGQAFALLGMFVTGILLARRLGPANYGLYSGAFALGSLTVGAATAGVPLLMLRRTSKADIDAQILRRAVFLLIFSLGIAIVATTAISAALLGGRRGAFVGAASGIFFAANNFATLGQYIQIGRRRYGRSAATDMAAGTLFPILTYGALKLHAGADGSFLAIAAACAFSCLIAWSRLPNLNFDGKPSPFRIRDSVSLSAFGLMNGGYGRIDTPTLLAVAGTSAAGYYSAAYRLLGPFTLLGTAVGTFYFSRISAYSGDRTRWTRVRKRGSFLLAATAIGGTTLMFAFAPLIVHFVYGSSYQESIGPARILLLSIVPWSLYRFRPADLASVHLELRATVVLGLGLLVDFLLVVGLGKRFGPTGAAWAWVISESFIFLALTFASWRIADRVGPSSDVGHPIANV
jgi:O-antigen/teichoic acid export membrane protein